MFTLFGQEAVEGDYVICEYHRYSTRGCGSPEFIPAVVHGEKAYAPYITSGERRWVRKETAIVKISKETAMEYFSRIDENAFGKDADFETEIQRNINAKKVTDIPGSWTEHRTLY